jgi:hypothetical protein
MEVLMKNPVSSAGVSLLVALLLMSNALSTTFYVDATAGNDSLSGDAPDRAWQSLAKVSDTTFVAGDTILFKAGERFEGQFKPKGSGSEGAAIVVDMYGDGDRPILDGAEQVNHVIRLQDVEYWELNNLEITNDSESQASRIGVHILSSGGVRRHFHLKNLYIHDIMGRYTFEMTGKNTGGIGIIGEGNTRFDNILIENCEIGDIVRVGIFTNGNKGERGNRPITNLVIRNNTIYRCAGDGAIIRYADKPIIEMNEAYENHIGDEELVQWGVALWCRSTDSARVQFNHVYKTYGDMDGQAFDADLEAWGTVVQNNYSHDNEGGFMLVYGSSADAIVRHNISQNDGALGGHIFDFPIWTNPRGSGIFHNNTIYLPEGNTAVIADEAMQSALFYNNIFYTESESALLMRDKDNHKPILSNNCYFGYSEEDVALDSKAITADPQLAAVGTGGEDMDTVDGYKLTEDSPCIGASIGMSDMGGNYWLPDLGTQDYFGNAIYETHIDIGAHQYSVEAGIGSTLPDAKKPSIFVVGHNYPNPFNNETTIPVRLSEAAKVDVAIYSMNGQLIKHLYSGQKPAGRHTFRWDGETENSRLVSSGMYLCRVNFKDSQRDVRKLIVVK